MKTKKLKYIEDKPFTNVRRERERFYHRFKRYKHYEMLLYVNSLILEQVEEICQEITSTDYYLLYDNNNILEDIIEDLSIELEEQQSCNERGLYDLEPWGDIYIKRIH